MSWKVAKLTHESHKLSHFLFSATKNDTVFKNHIKSLIQYCERSELRSHFEWTKVN